MELRAHPSGSFVSPDDPGERGSKTNPRLSVTEDEARVLARLAEGLDVLEIGTGLGISTRALAMTARKVVTFDTDPWVARAVAPDLPDNVEFCGTREPVPGEFDLAFIDGAHDCDSVKADIAFALAHLVAGGMLVFHDTESDGVRRAISDAGLSTTPLHTRHALAVSETGARNG